ncbi:bacillithiol biosynthesis cysteine-adding enzyme BshC [Amphibacillus jilinensis]|uniref:bacillithiol biosynthesis cysteine-adding enzyme BshC n=1 Tax=Amphibacillus jilinensis TaxID=1216008 RepID=UPI0002FAAA12|nr:bacillithiol biosynthesis cysteine-adding enzyme BshC [Amphibacillus jilinensis]
MKREAIQVNMSNLVEKYLQQDTTVLKYFDYNPYQSSDYVQRLADIKEQTYQRLALVDILKKLNAKWGSHNKVFEQIDRLKQEDSVVVIGGQQAGLLTGPLYTIHKMISILVFAREKEQELHIPVIPVFWIAGEDHDFDEINHVFRYEDNQLHKHKINQFEQKKTPISKVVIDQAKANQWLNDLFCSLPETEYTSDLYQMLMGCLDNSQTYVDFFAQITTHLFGEYGLVLFDSGDPIVRDLESPYLVSLIEDQQSIAKNVYKSWRDISKLGYHIPVDVKPSDGHLFYVDDEDERQLLMCEGHNWTDKDLSIQFTTDQLIQLAQDTPEHFSNNVISRPLMQECLFPTLAFFAGAGELAYWSILKEAFHELDLKMPPVLPRLSFTLVDSYTRKWIDKSGQDISAVINYGLEEEKVRYLAAQVQPPLDQLTYQIKESMRGLHQPLREIASSLGEDLEQLAEKNQALIEDQVSFLAKSIEKRVKQRHQLQLSSYDHLQSMLRPYNAWQERHWNLIPFINRFGTEWLADLLNDSYDFREDIHYLAKL